MGILGIKTVSFCATPSENSGFNKVFVQRFNLKSSAIGGFKFRSSMIGAPIFKIKLCCGIPGGFRVFKNSTGKLTESSISTTESTDL